MSTRECEYEFRWWPLILFSLDLWLPTLAWILLSSGGNLRARIANIFLETPSGGLIVAAVGWGAALGIGGLLVLMYMHEWIVAFLMYRRVKATDQGSVGPQEGPPRTQVVPQSAPPSSPSSRPILITLQDEDQGQGGEVDGE